MMRSFWIMPGLSPFELGLIGLQTVSVDNAMRSRIQKEIKLFCGFSKKLLADTGTFLICQRKILRILCESLKIFWANAKDIGPLW